MREHKRINLLQGKGYVDYEELKIGQTFVDEVIDNKPRLVPAFMYGIHVPLRKTLKCFLELPGLLTEILKYTHKINGITYKIGSFFVNNMQDSEKEFGRLVKIMVIDN